MDLDTVWAAASDREREALSEVYSPLRDLRDDWKHTSFHALALEIFEVYDFRSWSHKIQLSDFIPTCQHHVSLFSDARQLDRVQRANCLQLALVGISFIWNQPTHGMERYQLVMSSLIAMGRRAYPCQIPTAHYHDHGSLRVAQAHI